MDSSVREPVVAGAFYPGSAQALERQLAQLIPAVHGDRPLLACIAPHAGYVYSGGVAGQVFAAFEVPARVIVLGPNHTGRGARIAVAPETSWRTPLGGVEIDRELADRLLAAAPEAELDAAAHGREHSIEVMLPFLVARRRDVRVLPICLAHLELEACRRLGAAIAEVVRAAGEPVGVVASSDMSHYEPDAVTRERDRLAIDAALALDPGRLYRTVHDHHISMCGVVPATVALTAAVALGASTAELVAYATSGDVNHDRSAVVGYAGLVFSA